MHEASNIILNRNKTFHDKVYLNPGEYSLKLYLKKISGPGIVNVKILNDGVLVKTEKIKVSKSIISKEVSFIITKKGNVFLEISNSFPGKISLPRIQISKSVNINFQDEEKKIAFVIPYSILGGAEVYICNILEMISGLNIKVDLLYIAKNPLENIINLPFVRHINCNNFNNFKSYIVSFSYDCVFYYNSKKVFDKIKNTNAFLNSKIIEICHSDLTWADSISDLENRKHIDIVVKVNDNIAKNIKDYKLLPPFINIERFKSFDVINSNVIGTIARFSNEKNLFYILELAKLNKEFNFIVMGEGNLKGMFINKIHEYGLKNIKVKGYTLEPEKEYRKFGLFLLPSNVEGLPLTILEAMSHNIPVLAPNIGGISNLIENNLVYELSRNPIEDSNKIKKLINKNVQTRSYIIDNHSYSSNIDIFKKLIAEKDISARNKYEFEKTLDCYYV